MLAAVIILTTAAHAAAYDVIPSGNTVGIRIETDGVLVVELGEVETESGKKAPAVDAGVKVGDIITAIGSESISSGNDFKEVVSKLTGDTVKMQVQREDKQVVLNIKPAKNLDGNYELGLWLRDGMAGIGTLTFYDPQTGIFGALGHPVSDIDTGTMIPVRDGCIFSSIVTGVVRGQSGKPGQLQGSFDMNSVKGKLCLNTEQGLFGTADDALESGRLMETASLDEVELGEATILSNISGDKVEEYKIRIVKKNPNDECRNMTIEVTDPRLIEQTGGIVQGMSGSPIIQNGKLIGAVTHVLVNDPLCGYGIGIEQMLEQAVENANNLAA